MPIQPPIQLPIQLPQEIIDQILATMKEKLPTQVDDAILLDIITTDMEIVSNYVQSLIKNRES
jgi:hypothetical protein